MAFKFAVNFRTIVTVLRITQVILITLVLALSAHVANWWTGFYHGSSPSQINFLIFNAIWSALCLIYMLVVPWRFAETAANHKLVMLAVESVTAIFWLSGFVALAVFLQGRVCMGDICSAVQAADVFSAFTWIAFSGTAGMAAIDFVQRHMESIGNSESKVETGSNVQLDARKHTVPIVAE